MAYPKINSTGHVFRETFDSAATVINNGGVISGNVEVDNGATFDDLADEITYEAPGLSNFFRGGGTVRAKFVCTGYDGTYGLVFGKQGSNTGWNIAINEESGSAAKVTFIQYYDGTDGIWRTADLEIVYGQEYDVVVVYSSDSTINVPTMYINGIEVDLETIFSPAGNPDDDSAELVRFANISTGIRGFEGTIYEGSLYDRELTAQEIRDLYHNESPSPLIFDADFSSQAATEAQGGTVGAGISFANNAVTTTGVAGVDYTNPFVPESEEWTLYLRAVTTDLALTNGLFGQYYDAVNERFLGGVNTNGTITVRVGTTNFTTTNAVTEGAPFTLLASRDASGNVSVSLDGGTPVTGVDTGDIDRQELTLLYYSEAAATAWLVGTMYEFKIYDKALTADELDTFSYENSWVETDDSQALITLPLRAAYNDGSDQVTENIGSLGGTVQLGDGSTSSTFPTQLSPKGMEFDGANTYLECGDEAALQNIFDTGASVSFVLKPFSSGEGGFGRVMDKGSSSGWFVYTRDQAGHQLRIAFYRYFSGTDGEWRSPLVDVDRLHHVVISYDASDVANEPVLYLDGEVVAWASSTTPTGTADSDAGNSLLIADSQGHNRSLDGRLWDVRVFDTELTETQAKWLYQKDINLINQ